MPCQEREAGQIRLPGPLEPWLAPQALLPQVAVTAGTIMNAGTFSAPLAGHPRPTWFTDGSWGRIAPPQTFVLYWLNSFTSHEPR